MHFHECTILDFPVPSLTLKREIIGAPFCPRFRSIRWMQRSIRLGNLKKYLLIWTSGPKLIFMDDDFSDDEWGLVQSDYRSKPQSLISRLRGKIRLWMIFRLENSAQRRPSVPPCPAGMVLVFESGSEKMFGRNSNPKTFSWSYPLSPDLLPAPT